MLNYHQARWSLYLSQFNYSLTYRAGRHSAKLDVLSRHVDHQPEGDDNKDQIMLPAERFTPEPPDTSNEHLATEETDTEPSRIHIETNGSDIMTRIHSCTDRDESVMRALKELGSGVNLRGDEWEECDGLVLFRGKVYVLLDTQLQHDIVEAHHDTPVTGHLGKWKTTELVARNYWWPGMGHYIAKYVKGCDLCNQTKTFPTAPMGKLMPNRIPYRQWQIISVDLITELPQSHGYDSILVAVDCLSKWGHFITTTSDITLLGVARLFQDGIWKLHRLPKEVISDRGPQFVLNFM